MGWLVVVAIAAAVVGFAGGFITCTVCLFSNVDNEDNYVEYEAEEWF